MVAALDLGSSSSRSGGSSPPIRTKNRNNISFFGMLFFHIIITMSISEFLIKWRAVPMGIALVSFGLVCSDTFSETGIFRSATPVIVLIVTSFVTLPLCCFILLLQLTDSQDKRPRLFVVILRAIALGVLILVWVSLLVPMFLLVCA